MHKNNKNLEGYDFKLLIENHPELSTFSFLNTYGKETIDFFKPEAVKALNTAILKTYYGLSFWEFPDEYLCPGIPGRVDYIHHINDLLKASKLSNNIKVLDIGVGASCIYPLLGHAEYDWEFVGSDCNKESIAFAETIITKNDLSAAISLRTQPNKSNLLEGVLTKEDSFSVTLCNPPFYKNEKEALEVTTKKLRGLGNKTDEIVRNFSGQASELWFEGGEKAFLHTYLYESSLYKKQSFWFTSLVSNKDHVTSMYISLKKLNATKIVTIDVEQGNKKSRIIAWTFLTPEEQEEWVNKKQ